MFKNKLKRVAAVGTIAGLLLAAVPATVAQAATTPTYPTGSDGQLWTLEGANTVNAATDHDWAWGDPAGFYGSPISVTETPVDVEPLYFPIVSNAGAYTLFISLPGDERTKANWKAWDTIYEMSSQPDGVILPNLTPIIMQNGQNAAIQASGGTFSIGIAYLATNLPSSAVVKAIYTTINVDPGGNFRLAQPTPAVEKTDTTTTVAASDTSIHTGDSVELTATVAPSAASGNVEFFSGSTSLGTVAVAAGQAILTTTALVEGNNSVTAQYSGDDAHNGSTSAAVTVDVTAIAGPDSEDLTEANKGSVSVSLQGYQATVNVGTANNGKVVNVFGYSAATFLGQRTVANGVVTVSVSSLAAGEHQLAVVDNATDAIIGWNTFTLSGGAEGSPADIPVNATVRTSIDGAFQLVVADDTVATIDDPQLDPVDGSSVSTGALGAFSVIDDRIISHKGWDLTTTVAPFTSGSNTVDNTALGLKPLLVDAFDGADYGDTVPPVNLGTPEVGAEQVAGSAVYASQFAELEAGTFNPLADLNADLTFKAPVGTPAGVYNSTLTLTLVSK